MSRESEIPSRESAVAVHVHVPFCRRRCPFCAVYSVTGADPRGDDFVAALAVEWRRVREELLSEPAVRVRSIYIGGGTPSLLGAQPLAAILELLQQGPPWEDDCEVSLELNPEDVDGTLVERLRGAGYRRFSLGVQSFDERALKLLGRGHSSGQAQQAIDALQASGCENLNIDLMFGIPGQNLSSWGETLNRALAGEPQHLSCYPLTRAEESLLDRLLAGSFEPTPLEETTLHQYQRAQELLTAGRYELYEVAHGARAGFRCRHHGQVSGRAPVYGLGPGAHSFDGRRRWRTLPDLDGYFAQLLTQGQRPPRMGFRLEAQDAAREEIFLGIRQARGVSWARLAELIPAEVLARLQRKARFLAAQGYLQVDAHAARLQPQAYYVADSVALELMATLAGGAS